MNAKLFKRAAAGAVALTMLGVILPADSDLTGLSDGAAFKACAADASAVFGKPIAEGGYVLENNKTTYCLITLLPRHISMFPTELLPRSI